MITLERIKEREVRGRRRRNEGRIDRREVGKKEGRKRDREKEKFKNGKGGEKP